MAGRQRVAGRPGGRDRRLGLDLALGALLLFDEVITGFRLGVGGATAWSGVTPDLWCFGKVIGGGLPVGAFASSAEVMGHLAQLGGVYQAGTLSGNPLATAAGLAVLSELDEGAHDRLSATATTLAEGFRAAFADAGVAAGELDTNAEAVAYAKSLGAAQPDNA